MPGPRPEAVRAMFARIARVYDPMNRLLSLGLDGRWRRRLARRVDPAAARVLDLCAGTGDLGLAVLAVPGTGPAAGRRTVLAADFCLPMLAVAANKRRDRRLEPLAADALRLPLATGSVDAVTVGFGLRNLADPRQGLAEMARVLRPGGQLLLLDFFGPDRTAHGDWRPAPLPLRRLLDRLLPLGGRLVARDRAAYAYLAGSMAAFLTPTEAAAALRQAGLDQVRASRQALGIAHLVEARKPGPPLA